MQNGYFDDLKNLVAAGELEKALTQLLGFLKGLDRDLYDVAVAITADLRGLQRQHGETQAQLDEWIRARAPLNRRTLALINLASNVRVKDQPVPTPPALAPTAAGKAPAGTYEKIIGADRLMSLAWIRRGLTVARAVCRIETPQGTGTGFLVEGGVLVTNHHVLRDAATAERSIAAFNFEEDERGNLLTVHRYELDATRFRTSAEHDCTAVAVRRGIAGAASLAEWGFLKLNKRPPSVGDFVSIIQHPGGAAKKIALSENQIVNVLPDLVQYTTDTLPGSSGSPVLDDDWQVIGIHHAGGQLSKGDGSGDSHFTNEGILSAAVHAAVLA